MQKRIKKNPCASQNWRDDPGEKACRIWQWWKIVFNKNAKNFPAFKLAIRLVVLSQLSSCAVERVFSRLKLIRESCKDSLYEDMLENRIMMQCNGDLDEVALN